MRRLTVAESCHCFFARFISILIQMVHSIPREYLVLINYYELNITTDSNNNLCINLLNLLFK